MMKRVFDIFISFWGLIFLLPLFMIVAIAIIIDSKGGVFFLQTRVGRNNRDFKIFKFRTMHKHSEKKGLLTVGNKDNRVTRVGLFIRRYKVDELPQLINVFIGNMSLVGPRPEVRKYVDLYNQNQIKVLNAKPGITDPASIAFRNENELLAKSNNPEKTYIEKIMPAKLELNLEYIDKAKLKTDFCIIWKTIKAVLR